MLRRSANALESASTRWFVPALRLMTEASTTSAKTILQQLISGTKKHDIMKTLRYSILPLCVAALASCGELNVDSPETQQPEAPQTEGTVLTATISPSTKTVLGGKDDTGHYKVSWAEKDKINVNGVESGDVAVPSSEGTAFFSFGTEMTAPFKAVYPSSAFKSVDGETVTVTVPAKQTYAEGTFDAASALMYASAGEGTALTFHHLMAYLKLSFKTESDLDNIKTISIKSRGTESMSGDFTVDFTAGTLAAFSGSKAGSIMVDCGEKGIALGKEVIVAVPAQTYASGLEIVTTDINGDKTTHLLKKSFEAKAGTVYPMPIEFELYPGSRMKPVTVKETVDGVEKDIVWAPVYCGYSAEHPNGLLYQYGRAVGQPYYPASKKLADNPTLAVGPIAEKDIDNSKFYTSNGEWYGEETLKSWPMSASDEGYVEGKIGNPCPKGWRLPTIAEAQGLIKLGFTQSTKWAFNESKVEDEKLVVNTGFTLNGDSGLFFAAVGGRTEAGQSYYRGSGADAYARMWLSDVKTGTEDIRATAFSLRRNGSSNAPDGYKSAEADLIMALKRGTGLSVRCVKSE